MITVIAFLAMFVSTLLSGFRSRCIALNQPIQASVAGVMQTAGELAVVALIVTQTTATVIVASSLAAGLGYWISMLLHTRLNKAFFAERKKQKKAKQEKRIRKAIKKAMKGQLA